MPSKAVETQTYLKHMAAQAEHDKAVAESLRQGAELRQSILFCLSGLFFFFIILIIIITIIFITVIIIADVR